MGDWGVANMCYTLWGNIIEGAYNDTFLAISGRYTLAQTCRVKKREIPFQTDINGGAFFYIWPGCSSAVGTDKRPNKTEVNVCVDNRSIMMNAQDYAEYELTRYVQWLKDLRGCPHLEILSYMKYWQGTGAKRILPASINVPIKKVDKRFFLTMQEDTFYRISYQ